MYERLGGFVVFVVFGYNYDRRGRGGSEDDGGEEAEKGELVAGLFFFSSPNFSGSALESSNTLNS